jgi:hypothetical protein
MTTNKLGTQFLERVACALKPGGRFIFVSQYRPPISSARYWIYRGLNAVVRVRNLVVRPPFPVNRLAALLPDVQELLESCGFEVEVKNVFEGQLAFLKLVIATLTSQAFNSGYRSNSS